jgi:uncharacterized protein (TIGR02001 family)
MKSLKISLLAAAATLAVAGAAQADDAPAARPLGIVFNVGGATDYVFRGVSQTNGDMEGFGGIDATLFKIGYVGAWTSNVNFGDSTSMEYDVYFGVRPTLGPVSFDFGGIRYGYTHQPVNADWTYWEGKAAASMPVGPATLGLAFAYSPNATGPGKLSSEYYEFNFALPFKDTKFSASGAVGYQAIQGPLDYTQWNLGLGYAITDKAGLDIRYWDTSQHGYGKSYKARLVASIKVNF